jgi:hypothetical protein
MQIAPAFAYREIVPFLKTQKVRLLAPGEVPEVAQRGNAIPISHTEFQLAAREYPIVFKSGDEGKASRQSPCWGSPQAKICSSQTLPGRAAFTCRPMRAATRSAWPR